MDLYARCLQCPRKCGSNRLEKPGFCAESEKLRIASACLHFGEEPLITVHGGSGTIFLTGCNLRCSFCQNYQISQLGMGTEVSKETFAEICLRLEALGAENINIVTGSHHIPAIADSLAEARKRGLNLPICWNSSGYDDPEMLRILDGLVTIWLPDLKTLSASLAQHICGAPDYPERAKKAIAWMIEHNPLHIVSVEKEIDGKKSVRDKILQGVIVRHLFLPGKFEETADVLEWLKHNADGKAIISLMSQYTPVPFRESEIQHEKRLLSLSAIENRLVNKQEDADLRDLIEAYDFDYLFYQELCNDTEWLPDFEKIQPFSYKLAQPAWHFSCGFIRNEEQTTHYE